LIYLSRVQDAIHAEAKRYREPDKSERQLETPDWQMIVANNVHSGWQSAAAMAKPMTSGSRVNSNREKPAER